MADLNDIRHIHGLRLNSREVGRFLLRDATYPARFQIPKHSHENAYFVFVRRGAFTENYGQEYRSYRLHSLSFHPSKETHSDTFHSNGGHCFNIEMSYEWLCEARQHGVELTKRFCSPNGVLTHLAARLYDEYCHIEDASSLIVEGLIMEIVGHASRSEWRFSDAPRWLTRAHEVICENFSEPYSLAAVAGIVGIHPTHLARGFRRYYGQSIGEYLQRIRIDYACRKLREDKDSLVEIALGSGFSDQSHFSKTFRRLTGQTPSAFRRKSRER